MTISIWIDGDACPKAIKEITYKAAIRTKTPCIIVANHYVNLPRSPFLKRLLVEQGYDKADDAIEEKISAGDIVITADIPLADSCLKKNAYAFSPRGQQFESGTIQQKLAMRDFNETMRSSGIHSGGPSQLSEKDIRQFANCLDRLLTKSKK